MTFDNHPITPPSRLMAQQWSISGTQDDFVIDNWAEIATKAARWGADQQLAICVKWLEDHGYDLAAPDLQDHCRPAKPQPPQTVVIDGHTYHLAK